MKGQIIIGGRMVISTEGIGTQEFMLGEKSEI